MKFIISELLQKAEGSKQGRYLITLEVTDYDMDMFEDLATTYAPWDYKEKFYSKGCEEKKALVDISVLDFNDKFRSWIGKTWHNFHKLWRLYC